MDMDFLKRAQAQGWVIDRVLEDKVIAACPNQSCGMKVALSDGAKVPKAACGGEAGSMIRVESFDDFRIPLRDARHKLGVSISEANAAIGLAQDHLAKFERDTWADQGKNTRIPNIQHALWWAEVFGFEVYLKRGAMPAVMLRLAMERSAMENARRISAKSA